MAENSPAVEKADSDLSPEKQPSFMDRFLKAAKSLIKVLGPGILTGAADDDPAGIGTYAAAGAALGFRALWTPLYSLPMMACVQFICAKIGLVTGKGVAGVLKEHYPRWLVYPVVLGLLITNTINAGVDIGAIAAAINLVIPGLAITLLIIPIAAALLALQIWGSYKFVTNAFKWFTIALFGYVGASLFVHPNFGEMVKASVLPNFQVDNNTLPILLAVFGTAISPYAFFWQANLEVEEKRQSEGNRFWRKGTKDEDMQYASWDVNIGMFFANVIMYAIILATAATLYKNGTTHIQSATDAAQALKPLAGNIASLLLAAALIGAGFLAVPTLITSAAYAVAETFGWNYGLDEKPYRAKQFYIVIVLAVVCGMLINFIGINPIDALVGSSILNGFLSPFLLVAIMLISGNKRIMGNRTNSWALNLLGWVTTLIMFGVAVALVWSMLHPTA